MALRIETQGDETRLLLGPEEVRLLRRALERASFIDIPPEELPRVVAFATRVLESLTGEGVEPARR